MSAAEIEQRATTEYTVHGGGFLMPLTITDPTIAQEWSDAGYRVTAVTEGL